MAQTKSAHEMKIRFSHIRNYLIDDESPPPAVGTRFYVIVAENQGGPGYRPQGQNFWYTLSPSIPHSNRGIERAVGWLGTTDNIYHESYGRYEVVGSSSTHLHLREVCEDD